MQVWGKGSRDLDIFPDSSERRFLVVSSGGRRRRNFAARERRRGGGDSGGGDARSEADGLRGERATTTRQSLEGSRAGKHPVG